MKRAVLLYQAGIANVFEVNRFSVTPSPSDTTRKRLLQADFAACENFARGLRAAGVDVISMHANVAGDATNANWSYAFEDMPFYESANPVYSDGLSPLS